MHEVLSIHNEYHIEKAARLAGSGEPIAFENRGVFAILGDGHNPRFKERLVEIKGEKRQSVPIALVMPSSEFTRYLDFDRIAPQYHQLMSDPGRLREISGSLFFFRAPLKRSRVSELPASAVSDPDTNPTLQSWDPAGHRPAEKLVKALADRNIRYQAISSLNVSGKWEIVDREEAEQFAREKDLLLLVDSRDKGRTRGSYPIVSVDHEGLKLVREGNIPTNLILAILGEIETAGAKPAKYTVEPFPEYLLTPDAKKTRQRIINYLNGKNRAEIGLLELINR